METTEEQPQNKCQTSRSTNIEINGDVNNLVQVINNMISNSIQAYNGKTNETIKTINIKANITAQNGIVINRDNVKINGGSKTIVLGEGSCIQVNSNDVSIDSLVVEGSKIDHGILLFKNENTNYNDLIGEKIYTIYNKRNLFHMSHINMNKQFKFFLSN